MSGAGPVAPESPGRILRSAREALGLSRREVAEALNLLESVVTAIEDDDTARQPELVFMRGYVRNYARLLKLDPEPLVGALSSGRAAPPVRAVQTVPNPARWVWPAVGLAIALAVLAGVVFSLLHRRDLEPSPDEGASAGTVPQVMNTQSGPLQPIPETVAEALAPLTSGAEAPAGGHDALVEIEDEAETAAGGAGASGGRDTENAGSPPVSADGLTQPADEGSTVFRKRLNRGERDTLRLSFASQSWVRIKDNTGKMLFSDMGRPGREMELVGTGPFDLLLGYAPGVTLDWNGNSVALEPHMRNNVATLVLGQTAPIGDRDG